MATNWRGLSFWREWDSTATYDLDAAGPWSITTPSSAISVAKAIETQGKSTVDSSFTLSIDSNGYIVFSCDNSFDLEFDSLATAAMLGYSSADPATSDEVAATSVATGVIAPWTTYGVSVRGDYRSTSSEGIVAIGSGVSVRTPPGADSRRATASILIPESWVAQYESAYQVCSYSAPKVDLFDTDLSVTTYWLDTFRIREKSTKTRIYEVTLELVRS